MITAQQAAAKWATNLGASTQNITNGVQAVTVAPGQKAAAAKALWLQRVQNAADKWARNVGGVTLAQWQQAMISKGIPRISGGATAAQPKFEAFMSDFLNYLAQNANQVNSMPKGDINASIARAVKQIQINAAYKKPAGV